MKNPQIVVGTAKLSGWYDAFVTCDLPIFPSAINLITFLILAQTIAALSFLFQFQTAAWSLPNWCDAR